MNRTDLQALAEIRLKEANVLLDNGCSQGAFYLAGYSVECALKARIARATQAGDFPDKKTVEKSWKHNLEELLGAADLKAQLKIDSREQKAIGDNWAAVAPKWNESSRYERGIDKQRAVELFDAISESPHGVLAWLRQYW